MFETSALFRDRLRTLALLWPWAQLGGGDGDASPPLFQTVGV